MLIIKSMSISGQYLVQLGSQYTGFDMGFSERYNQDVSLR